MGEDVCEPVPQHATNAKSAKHSVQHVADELEEAGHQGDEESQHHGDVVDGRSTANTRARRRCARSLTLCQKRLNY